MNGDNSSSVIANALQIFDAKGTYTKKEFDDDSITETFTGTASQIAAMKLYDTEGTYTKHQDATEIR